LKIPPSCAVRVALPGYINTPEETTGISSPYLYHTKVYRRLTEGIQQVNNALSPERDALLGDVGIATNAVGRHQHVLFDFGSEYEVQSQPLRRLIEMPPQRFGELLCPLCQIAIGRVWMKTSDVCRVREMPWILFGFAA